LHQSHQGLRQADLPLRRDLDLTLLHAVVALQQQRFGVGVFLLAQQDVAEQRLRVEGGPEVRLRLLADGQALAEEGVGVRPFPLV
jgi:hypothetical protein